jgi:predicted GNAT family acetyltransferase
VSDSGAVVRHSPDLDRYEIWVDDELAGFTEYRLHGVEASFVHTEIGEQFGGRGLATTLIREALDDARGRGWSVLPYCPFVKAFVAKHTEYLDLVPEGRRATFGLG